EYLLGGGTGEPPPVPQRHYWNGRYQTPEGQQAIDQWFAGCRQGASAGQENMQRQLVTIPSAFRSTGVDPELPPVAVKEPAREVLPVPARQPPQTRQFESRNAEWWEVMWVQPGDLPLMQKAPREAFARDLNSVAVRGSKVTAVQAR